MRQARPDHPLWEIYVNVHGKRFMREDQPSPHARELALLEQPDHRYWAIFDARALEKSEPFIRNWSRAKIRRAFRFRPTFTRASSLSELAAKTGIEEDGLLASVAEYNEGQQRGCDAFGREQLPAPIATPPFHAIRCQGCTLIAFGGLAVDSSLRVVREDGTSIEGLYAAGEVLGAAAFAGRARCRGMSLTPALTLGKLLGEQLIPLDEAVRPATD
jgi:fumarate reductase flavoprotein subunit